MKKEMQLGEADQAYIKIKNEQHEKDGWEIIDIKFNMLPDKGRGGALMGYATLIDKDDFIDFDNAIREGEKKGYNIAWSNQSFEYWIYLHFSYNDSALHRDDWVSKLNQLFKQRKLGNGYYEKNDARLFTILNEFDGPKIAIKNAKNRMAKFDSDNPSEFDPGTTVYELVEKLFSYLE